MPRTAIACLIAAATVLAAPAQAAQFFQDGDIAIGTGTAPTAASPYPSTVLVSGMGNAVSRVRVEIGLTHTRPDDLDLLLVSPGGVKMILMSDAGGDGDLSGAVLTFDYGTSAMPDAGPLVSLASYTPTNYEADSWPAGSPALPYDAALTAVNGMNPNGTWSLYVSDDTAGEVGSITFWRVIVDAPPSNDDFSLARPLSGPLPLVDATARTDFATRETGEPVVAGDGDHTAWWTWTPTATQDVVLTALGISGYRPSVSVYTGATLTTLTRVSTVQQQTGIDPAELLLHAVAGTPYRIQLNGEAGSNGEADLAIRLAVAPVLPPDTTVGTGVGGTFFFNITPTGEPLTLTVTGTPPPGVSLDLSDPDAPRLFGIATAAGTFPMTITATNTQGTDTQVVTIVITTLPVLTSAPLVSGVVGQPFSHTLTAGSPATSFNATSLPDGLAINALSGEITGTPTTATPAAGTTHTVSATNGSGTATQSLRFIINPAGAPVITSGGTLIATAGTAFSYPITAAPAATSYGASWWFPGIDGVAPGLPAGVAVNGTTGVLAGTIATPGTYRFIVRATNATGTGTRSVVLTVLPSGSGGTSTSGSGGSVDASGTCGLASGTAALLALSAFALARRRRR